MVVAYASRSLTEKEQSYGQLQRETLAIIFGCTKFQLYLLGNYFKKMADHKALISIFNNLKAQASFLIENVRLKLQGFAYTVEHIHGAINLSDYLSRHSISATEEDLRQTNDLEAYVNYIFNILSLNQQFH